MKCSIALPLALLATCIASIDSFLGVHALPASASCPSSLAASEEEGEAAATPSDPLKPTNLVDRDQYREAVKVLLKEIAVLNGFDAPAEEEEDKYVYAIGKFNATLEFEPTPGVDLTESVTEAGPFVLVSNGKL
jgi:hypothetical protein